MIRINLIPHAPRKREGRGSAIQQIVVMLLAIAAMLGYFYYQNNQLEARLGSVRRQLSDLEREIEEKKSLIQGLDRLETLRRETEQKLDVVRQVQQQRVNPVDLLDTLQAIVPNRVWFRELDERGGTVRVRGVAANPQDVAEFLTSLERNERFRDVRLATVENAIVAEDVLRRLQSQPNLHIVAFDLTFTYVRPGETPPPPPG